MVYFANSSNGLAIARPIVEEVVGDMRWTFNWLGYSQVDQPGWSARRSGYLAETAGEYEEAIQHFRQAVAERPDDRATVQRLGWLEELMAVAESPVTVPEELLESYAGSYCPRRILFDEAGLRYQRVGRGEPRRLIPLSESVFALEGMVDFRIEVVTDADGKPTKLVGHYIGGSDETPRDPDERQPD